jgi:hypothetical protein
MKKLSLIFFALLLATTTYAQIEDLEILGDGDSINYDEGINLEKPPKHLSLASNDFDVKMLSYIEMTMARGPRPVASKQFSKYKEFVEFDFEAWISEIAEKGDRVVFEFDKNNPSTDVGRQVIVITIN